MGISPEKWGPYFWGVIHIGCLAGTITPEFISMYPSILPCRMCGSHFAELLKEHPFPDSQDPMILFKWSVDAHNLVNIRTDKPILTVNQALSIWTSSDIFLQPPVPQPLIHTEIYSRPQFDIKNAIIAFLVLLLIFMFSIK